MPSSSPEDQVFRALADPTRRFLVERLSRQPRTVSALAQPLDMSVSAVMQHLRVLEKCGIVRSKKLGRVRTCHLEISALRTGEEWIRARRVTWERRLDRLGAVLAQADDSTDEEETIS